MWCEQVHEQIATAPRPKSALQTPAVPFVSIIIAPELQEGPRLEPELCYPWLDLEGTDIQLSNSDSCLSNARGEGNF